MKKVFILITIVMLVASVFAQSPEKMSYQAVVRNSSKALVVNTQVGMQISILQGTATGTAVYVETQRPSTNANGLVSIEIGAGYVESGSFAGIDWQNGPYFIKTETDPDGRANYSITGTSQLLSVPFALHAKTAENITGAITETDPLFSAWDKSTGVSITESQISDLDHFTTADETDPVYVASVASGITATDTTSWNNKLDSETDPTVPAHVKAITSDNVSDWNQAHGWGDHSAEGYATKAYVDALLARIEALEEKDLLNNGFTDPRDNNHYNVVKIGNQIWMAENLKVTKYNDGIAIPNVTDNTAWSELTTGALCDYDNTPSNSETYGKLYNWHAVNTGELCPTGWHVPSDAEWTELTDYLGGPSDAGGKLKETGTTHWNSPNTSATNETGFTALPGGVRLTSGTFGDVGSYGYWWSATEYNTNNAWYRLVSYGYSTVYRDSFSKELGFSVRCLRD